MDAIRVTVFISKCLLLDGWLNRNHLFPWAKCVTNPVFHYQIYLNQRCNPKSIGQIRPEHNNLRMTSHTPKILALLVGAIEHTGWTSATCLLWVATRDAWRLVTEQLMIIDIDIQQSTFSLIWAKLVVKEAWFDQLASHIKLNTLKPLNQTSTPKSYTQSYNGTTIYSNIHIKNTSIRKWWQEPISESKFQNHN